MEVRARKSHRSRQRGSTILYAIILAGAGAALAVANLELSTSVRKLQARREQKLRLKYVGAAAAALFETRALNPPLFVDPFDPASANIGGVDYDFTFTKGLGLKEVIVTVSSGGETLSKALAIDPRGQGPQLYGLYTKDFDMDKRLVLGSPGNWTHAFFGKDPKKNPVAGSFIYGAVDAGSNNPKYDSSVPPTTGLGKNDPASCKRLLWLPKETIFGNATINGRSVSGSSGRSYLIAVGGKATVTGTFTGRITIYSEGPPILKTPIVVTPGSTLVVMTDSDVDVQGVGELDCHLYTSGGLDIPNTAGTIDWTGSIVAKSVNCKTALNLTLDTFFYGDPGSYEDFYLPQN